MACASRFMQLMQGPLVKAKLEKSQKLLMPDNSPKSSCPTFLEH